MQARKYNSPSDVRVGVYTIMCNEAKFVKQWIEAHRRADGLYVLVNNSKDDTFTLLEKYKNNDEELKDKLFIKNITYENFRFDVARNDNLAMIPSPQEGGPDVLIQVDADETLMYSWYEDIQKTAFEYPNFLDLNYYYAWSHTYDDKGIAHDDRVIGYNKCHRNDPGNVWWAFPVHETLTYSEEYKKESVDKRPWVHNEAGIPLVYLHHWPDGHKSRGFYLKLLELRAKESPDDLYGLFYLAREYTFNNRWQDALEKFTTLYAKLDPKNDDMMMLSPTCSEIAQCYQHFPQKEDAVEFFFKKAIEYTPTFRDPYVFYAQWQAYQGKALGALETLAEGLVKSAKKFDWREQSFTWSEWKIAQVKADAYCYLQAYDLAWDIISKGAEFIKTPEDKNYASMEGFYGDYEFIRKKMQQLNPNGHYEALSNPSDPKPIEAEPDEDGFIRVRMSADVNE